MHKSIEIAPSLIAANFCNLGQEIAKLKGIARIHFDVMDQHFVPNLTMGPFILKSLASKFPEIFWDVHLMTYNLQTLITEFVSAGAKQIAIHIEADNHIPKLLQYIKSKGIKSAIAINPATSLSSLEYVLDDIDEVILMSVNPGFTGQKFISSSLNKIKQLNEILEKYQLQTSRSIAITVDGGVNLDNYQAIVQAGAKVLVMGAAIFYATDYQKVIDQVKNNL